MFRSTLKSERAQRSKLVVLSVIFLSTLILFACAPCGSISRISRFFSAFQKSKVGNLQKNGGAAKKEEIEEETYQEKLEKLLGDPSFVFVSTNQEDKGATAIVKSEDDTKIGSIPLEVKSGMIAINPEGTRAYVTSYNSNKILILDIENNKLVETIESKDEPFGIASNPNGKRVYITHHKSNYVSILDTDKNEIVGTIQVKDHPACVTVSFDGSKAYVGHTEYSESKEGSQEYTTSPGSNEIAVIDLKTNKLVTSIPTKGSTWSIAVKSDGSQIFATTYEPYIGSFSDYKSLFKWSQSYWNGITVIDTAQNRVSSEIQIPERITPRSIALTPDDNKAYVLGSGSDELRVIDVPSQSIKTKITLGLGG